MAKRIKKVVRPTLDEVKAQSGRYVVATVVGPVGPISMKAPRPRTRNDVELPDLILPPHIPVEIDEEWLDNGTFRKMYERFDCIRVGRVDLVPEKPDIYSLPPNIESQLSAQLRNRALSVATNPYTEPMRMLIHAQNNSVMPGGRDLLEWELTEMRPFLQAVREYETRLGNRPEVLRDVKKRLDTIHEKTSIEAQRNL